MAINISTSAAVFAWQPAAWLRVSGPDSATFLQGQFTNDLRALTTQPAVYGLWLTVKGKVLADSFVLRGVDAEEFWLGSYFSEAATIRERLESHVIADDVTIEDQTAQWRALSFVGGGVDALLSAAPEGVKVFRGRRTRENCVEWVFPHALADPIARELNGARELTPTEIARMRIGARIPAIPADIGPGELPNEGELEADAISYTKGCYLGQEVMARLKSMGQVRRRLLRVRGSGAEFPATPAPVFAGGRQVGELRSAVAANGGGWIGLALVSLLHVKAGAELSFAPDGPVALRVEDSP